MNNPALRVLRSQLEQALGSKDPSLIRSFEALFKRVDEIGDSIIESGIDATSGLYYDKWSSGLVLAYGELSVLSLDIDISYLGGYRSDAAEWTVDISGLGLTEVRSVTGTRLAGNFITVILSANTDKDNLILMAWRGTTGSSVDCYAMVQVVGSWQ